MSIEELMSKIEALSAEERKRLAVFLTSLRHKELAEYRNRMAQKIDDKNPENWISLEDLE